MVLISLGQALSGLLAAAALKLGFLQPTWQVLGRSLSSYDAILLAYAVLIVLMVVTLGLVPSVIGKSQWIPR
jgi:hypothetical protein